MTYECLCTHLHDLAIPAAVQRVELVGFKVMWRDRRMKGGSLHFVFSLLKGFAVSGLSTAQGVRQRGLQHQQHLRSVPITFQTSLTVTEKEKVLLIVSFCPESLETITFLFFKEHQYGLAHASNRNFRDLLCLFASCSFPAP